MSGLEIGLPGIILIIIFFTIGYLAVTQTDSKVFEFKNPFNGKIREAPTGFSWTTFLFGPIPAMLRDHWTAGFIILLVNILTSGLSGFVFPFFYNKWYINHLIKEGYKVDESDQENLTYYLTR